MKLIAPLSVILFFFFAGCTATGDTHNHNYYGLCPPNDKVCYEQKMLSACSATANSYPYYRDRLRYEEYGALFTEDAVFKIDGGAEAIGRKAIVDALRARGPLNQTRHISTVVNMEMRSDTVFSGLSYFTLWLVEKNQSLDAKPIVHAPWIIGEYQDEYAIVNSKCLIKNRFVKIIFQGDKTNDDRDR